MMDLQGLVQLAPGVTAVPPSPASRLPQDLRRLERSADPVGAGLPAIEGEALVRVVGHFRI